MLAGCGGSERSRAAVAQVDVIGRDFERSAKLSYSEDGRLEHVETGSNTTFRTTDITYEDGAIRRFVERLGSRETVIDFDYRDGRLIGERASRADVELYGCLYEYNDDGLFARSRCATGDGTSSSTRSYTYKDGVTVRMDLEVTDRDPSSGKVTKYKEGTELNFDGEQLTSVRRRIATQDDAPVFGNPATYNFDYAYEGDRLVGISDFIALRYDDRDRIFELENSENGVRVALTYADVEVEGTSFTPPFSPGDFFDLRGRSFGQAIPDTISVSYFPVD